MKAATTAQDGTSWVTLTTNYGDMVYMFQTWPTSVKDFDNNNLVSIYPNPATDKITIALTDKRIASVQVVNVIGRKMARFEVDPSRDHSLTYNLDHVAWCLSPAVQRFQRKNSWCTSCNEKLIQTYFLKRLPIGSLFYFDELSSSNRNSRRHCFYLHS
jgi:hypothetical protein